MIKKNVKKILSAVLISAVVFSTSACNMIEKTEDAINRSAVAKVNGEKITRGQLDDKLKGIFEILEEKYGENYEKNTEVKKVLLANRQKALENMIYDVIMKQKADELDVKLTEEEMKKGVDEYIENQKALYEDEEKFKKALEDANITIEELRKDAETIVLKDKISEEVTKTETVSEEEAKKQYEANKEAYTEEPNEYKVSHILVATEEEAKKVKERLDGGEDFATVAKEVSLDAESKEKGGDLGYIKYNDRNMGNQLMTVVKVSEVGKVSEPMNDSRGWHIIKVDDKKEYPVKKFEDVKEEITTQLLEMKKYTKWNTTFSEWIKESDIKTYEKNLQ